MEDFSFGVFFLAFYHTLPHYFCEAVLGTSKFHAPRHTLAVTMHNKGAKITDISKALGHSDIKITSDYLEEHLSYENPLASELEEEWGI
jgi:integrase